jgi:glucose-1-phosphate adenylyltransferase
MDYGEMLAFHAANAADMTVACIDVPIEDAKGFGVMSVDDQQRVVAFHEKPEHPQPTAGNPDMALASMGIYVFNADFLYEQLTRDADDPHSSHDFGKDIIPYIMSRYRMFAHRFSDSCVAAPGEAPYWRDVGTVDAYWDANMELTKVTPDLNLYDDTWPIWTYQAQLPPAKFVFDDETRRGVAVDSLVSGGCIISGATVRRSLLFSNVYVHSFAEVSDSVLLPDVDIGRGARLHRAVVDKGCKIPEGLVVGENPEEDAKRFHVSKNGITLITPEMLGQRLHHLR